MTCLQLLCTYEYNARNSHAKDVLAIVETSIRLSVRLFVTLLYCVKMTQAKITKSSLADTETLVFLR